MLVQHGRSPCSVVVVRSPQIGVVCGNQERLGVGGQGLAVQTRLEDRLDALVGGSPDDERPLAGGLQPVLAAPLIASMT